MKLCSEFDMNFLYSFIVYVRKMGNSCWGLFVRQYISAVGLKHAEVVKGLYGFWSASFYGNVIHVPNTAVVICSFYRSMIHAPYTTLEFRINGESFQRESIVTYMGGTLQQHIFKKFIICWGKGGLVYIYFDLVSCTHSVFRANIWCSVWGHRDQN